MKYRVLVVDDMLVNTKILENMLTLDGYDVDVATSGKEALELAEENHYYCILLDLIMPGMNGFEVIKELKNSSHSTTVPVIFISGVENSESAVEGFELGAVDYITKPFNPREVQARVRSHIKLFVTIENLVHTQAETLKQINQAQNSLLKKPVDFPDLNFSVYYKALHAAGGDIYDIVEISDGVMGYFVGDFAGHSISTAFLTSSVRALLQQNCIPAYSPAESMALVNRVMCELMPVGIYLTAVYAVIDENSNLLTVVNMGHPPLLQVSSMGAVLEIGNGGNILGFFEEAVYEEIAVDIFPKDKIVLYTDGLIEGESVWSANVKGLKSELRQLSNYSGDELVESLLVSTEKFRSNESDDILVLAVERLGELFTSELINSSHMKLTLPSIISAISPAVDAIMKFYPLEVGRYEVHLALFELINNGVIHGNKKKYDKRVEIDVTVNDDSVSISVADSGRGFNWQKKMVHLHYSNAQDESGRGLAILKAYGFEIKFNKRGNSVTITKQF
jgi:sigma-B regulation protein RsbU (phosphoserine phosphatase)